MQREHFSLAIAPLIVFSVYIFSCHLNSVLVFYITSINYTKAASNRIQGKKTVKRVNK